MLSLIVVTPILVYLVFPRFSCLSIYRHGFKLKKRLPLVFIESTQVPFLTELWTNSCSSSPPIWPLQLGLVLLIRIPVSYSPRGRVFQSLLPPVGPTGRPTALRYYPDKPFEEWCSATSTVTREDYSVAKLSAMRLLPTTGHLPVSQSAKSPSVFQPLLFLLLLSQRPALVSVLNLSPVSSLL